MNRQYKCDSPQLRTVNTTVSTSNEDSEPITDEISEDTTEYKSELTDSKSNREAKENYTMIYPNPNKGKFWIEFNADLLKDNEIQ